MSCLGYWASRSVLAVLPSLDPECLTLGLVLWIPSRNDTTFCSTLLLIVKHCWHFFVCLNVELDFFFVKRVCSEVRLHFFNVNLLLECYLSTLWLILPIDGIEVLSLLECTLGMHDLGNGFDGPWIIILGCWTASSVDERHLPLQVWTCL